MGFDAGNGSSATHAVERRLRWLKHFMQGAVVVYIFGYAILYQQTHMQVEELTGSVDLQAWPGDKSLDLQSFARLPYCQGQTRCDFVNELDVLSMGEMDVFIPTHVVINHQKASCADGSNNTKRCRLDYGTGPESMAQVDEFFIGNVEDFKLSIGHAFHSHVFGEGVLADARELDFDECPRDEGQPWPPLCREMTPGGAGGHDRTSVGGLLELLGLTLESNNDETDHPGGEERFRESGIKLRIDVYYTNLGSWLGSWSRLGYSYKVNVLPSESVWGGLSLSSLREARAWLAVNKLESFASNDRILVWADGIEVSTKLHGKLGTLDFTQLLLTIVSAMLLLFFAETIVEVVAACVLPQKVGMDRLLAEQPSSTSCMEPPVAADEEEEEEEAGEQLLRPASGRSGDSP